MIIGRVFENPCEVYDFIKSHDRSLTTFFDVFSSIDDSKDLELLQNALDTFFYDLRLMICLIGTMT